MKLLDLFCKAGGCSAGYSLAGFEVTGVDIEEQPNYPFKFIQSDALKILKNKQFINKFDVIHASPPCQQYTKLKHLGLVRNGEYKKHVDLISQTRALLRKTGKIYVIENVVGSPLHNPIKLCGSMFGLKVYRHRLFESNLLLQQPKHFPHEDRTPCAGNGKSPKGFITVCGNGGVRGMTSKEVLEYWSFAMGIYWMTKDELAQAIPPAYTKYIGEQIINGKLFMQQELFSML